MTTDELERLRLAAEDAAGGPPSVEQVEALVDLVDALEAALAALTTGQGIDAPSVREAIGEVLADMGAVIEGMPVASDLAALTEITDAAIRAAVSHPSRTAKRTGYETVGHAVGEHSQTIRATAALTTPQELPKAEREARCPYSHQLDYCTKCGWTRPTPTPQEGDARKRIVQTALAHVPVLGVTGRVVGCRCMDRVFVQHRETWAEHVADAILAAFPGLSRTAAPEPDPAHEMFPGTTAALDALTIRKETP